MGIKKLKEKENIEGRSVVIDYNRVERLSQIIRPSKRESVIKKRDPVFKQSVPRSLHATIADYENLQRQKALSIDSLSLDSKKSEASNRMRYISQRDTRCGHKRREAKKLERKKGRKNNRGKSRPLKDIQDITDDELQLLFDRRRLSITSISSLSSLSSLSRNSILRKSPKRFHCRTE